MDKIEHRSELDTTQATELPGAGCCAAISEEEAATLIAGLTFEEKLLLYELLSELHEGGASK